MTSIGSFWFVPAKLRTYSALGADTVDIGGAVRRGGALASPDNPEQFWGNLASRDRAWLRRKGLPVTIAGSDVNDFPRGSVSYIEARGQFVVELDDMIAGRAYVAWVTATFSLRSDCTLLSVHAPRPPLRAVGQPKPWY